MSDNKVRPIAIYLPQFHPVAENNEWWGKGFTEWRNVAKAKPLFKGHYQPHMPADFGYYDLRLAEVRQQQADMAKQYGIYGFCYYHYWFNGRRILERPFQEVFESGEPDFPFMLCWANEHWTRTWEGNEKIMLLEQRHSDEDDLNHIKSLIPYFKDKRYIRVDDKPVIAIYNSVSIPAPGQTIKIWREEAKKHGLELYICRFESFHYAGEQLLKEAGFDAAIDFQPFGGIMESFRKKIIARMTKGVIRRAKYAFYKKVVNQFSPGLYHKLYFKYWEEDRRRLDYNEYVEHAISYMFPQYKWYPGITPGWDNTARKGERSFLLKNSTPEMYYKWFKSILQKFKPFSKNENFIFINAWNEWGEGNHLEPCEKWGSAYLEKTKQVLDEAQKS